MITCELWNLVNVLLPLCPPLPLSLKLLSGSLVASESRVLIREPGELSHFCAACFFLYPPTNVYQAPIGALGPTLVIDCKVGNLRNKNPMKHAVCVTV